MELGIVSPLTVWIRGLIAKPAKTSPVTTAAAAGSVLISLLRAMRARRSRDRALAVMATASAVRITVRPTIAASGRRNGASRSRYGRDLMKTAARAEGGARRRGAGHHDADERDGREDVAEAVDAGQDGEPQRQAAQPGQDPVLVWPGGRRLGAGQTPR